MKYRKVRPLTFMAALAVALLSISAVAHAQSVGIRAKIPFDFYVGSEKFPAGSYTVLRQGYSIARVEDEKGHASLIMTSPISVRAATSKPGLVFNRYGNYHFLSEVTWGESNVGHHVSRSSFELEIAKGISGERVVASNKNR